MQIYSYLSGGGAMGGGSCIPVNFIPCKYPLVVTPLVSHGSTIFTNRGKNLIVAPPWTCHPGQVPPIDPGLTLFVDTDGIVSISFAPIRYGRGSFGGPESSVSNSSTGVTNQGPPVRACLFVYGIRFNFVFFFFCGPSSMCVDQRFRRTDIIIVIAIRY